MIYIEQFSTTPANFLYFANNCDIEYTSPSVQIIDQFIKLNKVQWVIPLRTLCMRYIKELKIINKLHLLFLRAAINEYCLTEALPVADVEAIPFKLDPEELQEYQFYKFELYFKLGAYKKSYKILEELATKKDRNVVRSPKYTIFYLIMSRIQNKPHIEKEAILELTVSKNLRGVVEIDPTQEAIYEQLIAYAERK